MRIGIDNGISGGLVAISDHDGSYIDGITMPAKRWRSRNEIDVLAVRKWILAVCENEPSKILSVTIEEPNNSRTPSTAYSVASSFHSLRAMLDIWEIITWHRITPQSWQKEVLGKVPKGETKTAALQAALRIWPYEDFLASSRCKVSHEGIVDAALIAEFSRRQKL